MCTIKVFFYSILQLIQVYTKSKNTNVTVELSNDPAANDLKIDLM